MSINKKNIKSLWQTLPSEKTVFNHKQMQARAEKFQAKHRRRDIMEYLGFAALLALIVLDPKLREDWKTWVASALAVLGCIIMLWNYNRLAKSKSLPSSHSSETTLDYMRRELTRQRDAAATAWRWYILPVVPFFIFVMAYRWAEEGSTIMEFTNIRLKLVLFFLFTIAFLTACIFWKRLCAARYQRQLDELDKYIQS